MDSVLKVIRPNRRRRIALLLLWLLLAAPAWAGDVSPRLTVGGVLVSAHVIVRRDGEWQIPIDAVARALALEWSLGDHHIEFVDPLRDRQFRYEVDSGAILEQGIVRAFVAPGLLSGDTSAPLLPLSILALVLDLDVWLSPDERELILTRSGEADLQWSAASGPRWSEARYRAESRTAASRERECSVRFRGDVASGAFGLAGAMSQREAEVARIQGGTATFETSTRVFAVGDLSAGEESDWHRASGRGVSMRQLWRGGARRLSLSARRSLHGSSAGAPALGPTAISIGYGMGAPQSGTSGFSALFAASWREADSTGVDVALASSELRWDGARAELRASAGAFGESSGGRPMGLAAAGVLVEPWTFLRAHADLRAGASSFSIEQPSAGEDLVSSRAGLSLRAHPGVVFGVESAGDDDAETDGTTLFSLNLENASTPRASLLATSSVPHGASELSEQTLALHLDLPGGRGFAQLRSNEGTSALLDVSTIGFSSRGTPAGSAQVAGSWDKSRPAGGSFLWTAPSLWAERVQTSIVYRWSESTDEPRWSGRLRCRLPFSQRLELQIHRSGEATELRASLEGAWFRPPTSLSGTSRGPDAAWGEIAGRVYLDHDQDGVYGDGDVPLEGVTLELDRGTRRVVTDNDGSYNFHDVTIGEHNVALDASSVRADLTLLDSRVRSVPVRLRECTWVDHRAGRNRTVRGQVFVDENGNGELDPIEATPASVRILTGGRLDTVTDTRGRFVLGDLPPGRQVLAIDLSSIPGQCSPPTSIEILVPSDRDPEPIVWPLPIRRIEWVRKTFR